MRAAYPAMDLVTRYVIVPSALASLATGLVQTLGTRWGLFRHHWVVMKLLVTAAATVVLLAQLGPIRYLADVAAEATVASGDLRSARTSLVVHAGGGVLTLLGPTVLSVYEPRGLTRYGRRRTGELPEGRQGSDTSTSMRMPAS